jgi:predicted nucleotide-binding protein
MAPERLQYLRTDAEAKLDERIGLGRALLAGVPESSRDLDARYREYFTWTEFNKALLERMFESSDEADQYAYEGPLFVVSGKQSQSERLIEFAETVDRKLRRLESIRTRLELFDEPLPGPSGAEPDSQEDIARRLVATLEAIPSADEARVGELMQEAKNLNARLAPTYGKIYGGVPLMQTNYPSWVWFPRARDAASQALAVASAHRVEPEAENVPMRPPSKEVFIVHGRDHGLKEAVARLVQRLGYDAVILHLRPDMGSTVIEKLEREARDAAFAIVLLTPDDEGRVRTDPEAEPAELRRRARQNVVLEYGYFLGLLGRGRVVALASEPDGFDTPTDMSGVLYVEARSIEDSAWRYRIANEMKAAGLTVDLNDVEG